MTACLLPGDRGQHALERPGLQHPLPPGRQRAARVAHLTNSAWPGSLLCRYAWNGGPKLEKGDKRQGCWAISHLQLTSPWWTLAPISRPLLPQLLGMSDFQASLIAALFLAGTAIGALVGRPAGQRAGWRVGMQEGTRPPQMQWQRRQHAFPAVLLATFGRVGPSQSPWNLPVAQPCIHVHTHFSPRCARCVALCCRWAALWATGPPAARRTTAACLPHSSRSALASPLPCSSTRCARGHLLPAASPP